MGYKRKGLTVEGDNIEALRLLVEAAQKPYISVEEGRILYSMGTHAFADLAKDAKATRRIGRSVVNGRFCPQSVRNFCPIVAGFNAGTYKVPACVL